MLPADVNFSNWDCTLESQSAPSEMSNTKFRHRDEQLGLRLGLRLLRGFSEEHARQIEAARQRGGRFTSLEEFARRTQLGRTSLQLLSRADAFASLKIDRRDAYWKSLPAREDLPLFDDDRTPAVEDPTPELPEMTAQDQVVEDYSSAGLTLRKHPVSFLREQLTQLKGRHRRTTERAFSGPPSERWPVLS